jgi:glycosyltransferase involved in cell wall biosynthesis
VNVVLANRDYGPAAEGWGAHTTDEGMQLQVGLEHAGWTLAGAGYGDGCRDVPTLLERFRPEVVFVQDPRDWDPTSHGSFRKDIGFERVEVLRNRPDIFRAVVVKDAGSVREYQREFFERIGADAAVVYYHPDVVLGLNPWLTAASLVRTYHTVEPAQCMRPDPAVPRKRAVVTGAVSKAYPLREQVVKAASSIGVDVVRHPGYHNRGAHTPAYLALLARYRVHVATASRFGFALRKLVESVAVGATPVTNLPALDRLPEIDGALVRVSPEATVEEVADAVSAADRGWDSEERAAWATKARARYDWRVEGRRLSDALEAVAGGRIAA